MKKKYLLGAFLGLLLSTPIFAQDNIGVSYFNTGELGLAKQVFENQITTNPAQSYYYLGQIALKNGNTDEAKNYFGKGLQASPDYVYNNIGLASLGLKTDSKEAVKLLNDIAKQNKKDVNILSAIAQVFYTNNLIEEGNKMLLEARKADKRASITYIVEGDLKAGTNVGEAAGLYALAYNADPTAMDAYIKTAKIYETINPESAIEALNKALEVNPNYTLAYKYLGDIYYNSAQYKKAVDAYSKYYAKGDYTVKDLTHFAASYFFDKQYPEALDILTEGLAIEPNNFVLNRLAMYVDSKTDKDEEGLIQAIKFFALPKGDNKYIVQDYMTYGELLGKAGRREDALLQYEEAIKLDSTKVSIYKDIAQSSSDADDNLNAGIFYEKYIQKADTSLVEALDYFNMGRNFYYAGNELQKDNENPQSAQISKEALTKAANAFDIVAKRVPESVLGYLWRARSYASLDPETKEGLAKPYYEELLEVAKTKEDGSANSEIIEAYRYLAYYYYLQYAASKSSVDKEKVKSYSTLLIEMDPENMVATQLLDAIK